MTGAAPAERKSAVQQLMAAPLYAAERALAANSQADRTEAEMTKEVAGREYVRRAQDQPSTPGRRHRSGEGRRQRRWRWRWRSTSTSWH